MLGTKQKRPADVLDFDVDYEDWLTDDDEITTVTTHVTPSGQLAVQSVQVDNPVVKVWLTGGVIGSTYDIEVTASTSAGRVKVECFKVRVKDC